MAKGERELQLISPLAPPSLSRAWQTVVHPTLPIVATCSSDKAVRIYSLTSFTLLSTISGGHKRSVRSCAWKPGTKGESTLATGSFDASVGVWRRDDDLDGQRDEVDYTNGTENDDNKEEDEEWRFALVLDGHDSEVKSVAWSAGGNLLATCSRDKSVWIWEEVGEDDFETIAVLQEHDGDVKCVAWHPEEELVASASYDDDIRIWKEDVDDWGCISVLKGHESTVWFVDWESVVLSASLSTTRSETEQREEWARRREAAGPRLASCSDDMSIKIWRRRPREKGTQQNTMSIIKTGSIEEDWVEEAQLPKGHERVIYSVSWSRRSGLIVSTGGDGKIVVYEERWKNSSAERTPEKRDYGSDTAMAEATSVQQTRPSKEEQLTEWVVVAEMEGAHGVFEVNHVIWARRADKGKVQDDEEVILSTGDDGVVKVWSMVA